MTLPLTGIEVEVLAKQLREAISFGQAQARKAGGARIGGGSAHDWGGYMGSVPKP